VNVFPRSLFYRFLTPVVVFVLILSGALLNDSWLIYRAAYFLALCGLLGLLWTLLSNKRGIQAKLESSSTQVEAGQELELKVSMENPSPTPKIWLESNLPSDIPAVPASGASLTGRRSPQAGASFARVVSLPAYGKKEWAYFTPPLKRGLYHAGPLRLAATDPFLFQANTAEYSGVAEFLVYPRTEELPSFDPHLDRKQAAQAASAARSFFSDQAAGVRQFVYGDSLKRVHWPSTARTGKLMVKVLDASVSHQIWLVLDMHEGSNSTDGQTEEAMASAAASVAMRLLDRGLAVGLLYYGRDRFLLRSGRGKEHLFGILKALAVAKAEGAVPITQAISRESSLLPPGSSAIVFTPSADAALPRCLEALKSKGCSVRVVLLDPVSFGMSSLSQPMAQALRHLGITTYPLAKGQPLSEALRDDSGVAVGV